VERTSREVPGFTTKGKKCNFTTGYMDSGMGQNILLCFRGIGDLKR
jgi:hypothetical protein